MDKPESKDWCKGLDKDEHEGPHMDVHEGMQFSTVLQCPSDSARLTMRGVMKITSSLRVSFA